MALKATGTGISLKTELLFINFDANYLSLGRMGFANILFEQLT